MKTLTRNWRDHCRTGTQKDKETVSKYFDGHGHLSQSEESKCLWTHSKYGEWYEWFEQWNVWSYILIVNIFFIERIDPCELLIVLWTELRPLREKCQELTAEYEQKKHIYDTTAAGLESATAKLEQVCAIVYQFFSVSYSRCGRLKII